MSDADDTAVMAPGHRRVVALITAVVVMVIAAASSILLFASADEKVPAVAQSAVRPANATAFKDLTRAALKDQQAALADRDRSRYLAGWSSRQASSRHGRTTYDNLVALHARVHLREASSLSGADANASGPLHASVWTADVGISWSLEGFGRTAAHTMLTYTFVARRDGARVLAVTVADGAREPIWLVGRLAVRRTADTLVAAAGAKDAGVVGHLLELATQDVRAVVGSWPGGLVAYVPASTARLEAVVGSAPGQYDAIAAVTTTVDGSRKPEAPVAIVINPAVFDRLGPVGRHVVISHEATHAATGAAAVPMPLWVAEGFADYVGVGSVDVPLDVSAAAAIRSVARHGLPRRLPTDADFSAAGARLDVAYEQAWLAMRTIAHRDGQRRLVDFYEAVGRHPARVDRLVRNTLGTTRAALTRTWRHAIEGLVHAE